MNKEELLFQSWAVWYCHNHPDKAVGNAKAITVTKDFAGHTSIAPSCLDHRKRQTLRVLDSSQFSSLHAHSEIVTVQEGYIDLASYPAAFRVRAWVRG